MRAARPSLLGAPVILLILASPALAEEAFHLDEIVVPAEAYDQEGATVRTLGRPAIEAQGARHAAEVLEQEASLHFTSGQRGERILSLQGFNQRQVVVLIDGIPANIPYDGRIDLSLIPAGLIDHITVVKGPGSVLYGPNGLGGAINIVTRSPGEGPLFYTSFEGGQAGTADWRAQHSLNVGMLSYTVEGGVTHQRGFRLPASFEPVLYEDGGIRENSDRRGYHLLGVVRLRVAREHDLEGKVHFIDGYKGVPPSTEDPTPRFWRFGEWRSLAVSLGHSGHYQGDLEVEERVFVRLFDNLLDSYDDSTYTTQASPMAFSSWYHDQIFGGRVRALYPLERTPWGPTFLRLWMSAQVDRHGRSEGEEDLPPISRAIVTLGPEVEALLADLFSLTLGCQVDVEVPMELPDGGAVTRADAGPLVALRYDPLDGLFLRATVASRSRFPSLKERFSSAQGGREANPDLAPEKAWHFGLEASWRAATWLMVQARGFDAEVDDLITHVALGDGLEQLQNAERARLAGAELTVAVTPLRWLRLEGSYAFLHARRLDQEPPHLSYTPEHKATLGVTLSPWPWLEVFNLLRLVGPQHFQNPETTAWGSLGAYAVWDARVKFSPTGWAGVWVRATNILDGGYQTEFGFPDPGREVWVGVSLQHPEAK